MKRASWFVAAAVLAAACSDSTRPTSDTTSAPNIAAAPPAPSPCSFKDARDFSNAFFKLVADRKTAADFLKAADDAGAGTRTRNDRFFDLFRFMESARATGQTNAGTPGASLILEADDCGEFIISHRDAHLPDVLAEATGGSGAWEFRAGTEGFVDTQDGGAAIFTANWNTWIGGRSMIIAARRTGVAFAETTISPFAYRFAALYDDATPGFPATPGPSGQDDIATVELCQASLSYAVKHRLGKIGSSGAQTVLQVGDIAGFCPPGGTASLAEPRGVLARAISRIAGFFVSTAQARRRAPPGMGGDIGDISDFIGVDAGSVNLSYATQPTDGDVDLPFLVRVLAVAQFGTPLENVTVTLSVAGNSGQPAGAVLIPHPLTDCLPAGSGTPSLSDVTDETGIVAFCVSVDKSGGYRIGAASDFAGYPSATVISDLFNRTP